MISELEKLKDLENSVNVQKNTIEFMLGKLPRYSIRERHEKQRRIIERLLEVGL